MRIHRMVKVALAVMVLATCATACGRAAGSDTSSKQIVRASASGSVTKTIHLYMSAIKPYNSWHVILTGGIEDFGTAYVSTVTGKPKPNANYQDLKLRDGSFLLKDVGTGPGHFSHGKCSDTVVVPNDKNVLSHGTGKYAGIKGSVRLTATLVEVVPTYSSGSRKGQCDRAYPSTAKNTYQNVTGHGTVELPAAS